MYNCGHEAIDNGGGAAVIKGNYFHLEDPELQPDPSIGNNGIIVYQNTYPLIENNRFEKLSRAIYFLEDSHNKKVKDKQVVIQNNIIQNNDAAFGVNPSFPMESVKRENNTLNDNIQEESREARDE